MKAAIRKALFVDGYVDYKAARDVFDRAADVPVLIGNLLDSGDAHNAATLAEYALKIGFEAINNIDDSSGNVGDVLTEIASIHLEACEKAGLPAKALARSVLDLQIADDLGIITLEPYLKTLGEEGLAEYRRLAVTKKL